MTDIDPKPTNPSSESTDVGSILKQARLRRSQSYEVVFQHTRIPKKFLEALEANRFDEFPAAVYLHGFLKSYCEHLDLNFAPLWAQIKPSAPVSQAQRESGAPPPPPGESPSDSIPRGKETSPREASSWSFSVILAVVLGIGVVAALVWAVGRSRSQTPPPPPLSHHPADILPPVVKPPEKMNLKIVFRGEAWMSLRCDDRLRFEGKGPAGFTQKWTAMKEFKLRTSSPEDLSFELDGKPFPLASAARTSPGEYLIRRP